MCTTRSVRGLRHTARAAHENPWHAALDVARRHSGRIGHHRPAGGPSRAAARHEADRFPPLGSLPPDPGGAPRFNTLASDDYAAPTCRPSVPATFAALPRNDWPEVPASAPCTRPPLGHGPFPRKVRVSQGDTDLPRGQPAHGHAVALSPAPPTRTVHHGPRQAPHVTATPHAAFQVLPVDAPFALTLGRRLRHSCQRLPSLGRRVCWECTTLPSDGRRLLGVCDVASLRRSGARQYEE